MLRAGYTTENKADMRPDLRQFIGIKPSRFLQLISQYKKIDIYINMHTIIIHYNNYYI